MENIQGGESGDVAGQSLIHSNESEHSPANEAATSTSEAAATGTSAPERSSDGEGCTCGFCDGVTVTPGEDYDPRTGEVEADESFERMSRRSRCPRCGGINVTYKDSYVAHAADLVDREAEARNVYGLHVTLDTETVQRAGLDPEETYQLWTGDGAPWTRARRAMKRRDEDLIYLGTLSARSDGTYHLHLLVVTRLSVVNVGECLQVAGLDAYVQDFDRSEYADSKEQFAAQKAGYAFRNTARSPSSRFVSSQGKGAGYDSDEAKKRRREAVQDVRDEVVEGHDEVGPPSGEAAPDGRSSKPGSGARGPKRNQQREPDESTPESTVEMADNTPDEADSSGETGERAPPVRMDGRTVETESEYRRVVRRKLMQRRETDVHVNGMGRAELVKVAACEDDPTGLVCTVVPEVGEGTATVRWRQISARNAPLIRRTRSPAQKNHVTPMSRDETEDEGRDPVERFNEVAEHSTVTSEVEGGRRRVRVKDHRTGQVHEQVKPPRPWRQ